MTVILLCEYVGDRHSNPLRQFPPMEAAGPFDDEMKAYEYEEQHRYSGCQKHSVIPISPPEGDYSL